MKAVVITSFGDENVLQVKERSLPDVQETEVLLEVKAAGVNRPDIFQRKGNYPAPDGVVQDIPGLEVAGIISSVGRKVTEWKEGDAVCCLVAGGGYASHIVVDQDMCLPVPGGLNLAEAAALPETVFTVWDNVFRRGALAAGETLLVHGGTGGIGSTAIQLAKAFGANVYTTVGSDQKGAFCKELGADAVANYKREDFSEVFRNKEINVVLDSIGGGYFEKNIELLSPDGRLIYINAVEGAHVKLNLMKLMRKRITVTGSTLRARDLAFKVQLAREIQTYVWPLIGTRFRPRIYKELPLADAPEAHRLMEGGEVMGKIVLIP
ncbi:MAG TPA: NAD(P)H-quinone oxidoreductase [Sphingobacterium sp.]|jgi:NADPH2:quinone reductase|nr:NAD(P)H-quinone oxidoreductase [Sphingobacterium sp.]